MPQQAAAPDRTVAERKSAPQQEHRPTGHLFVVVINYVKMVLITFS